MFQQPLSTFLPLAGMYECKNGLGENWINLRIYQPEPDASFLLYLIPHVLLLYFDFFPSLSFPPFHSKCDSGCLEDFSRPQDDRVGGLNNTTVKGGSTLNPINCQLEITIANCKKKGWSFWKWNNTQKRSEAFYGLQYSVVMFQITVGFQSELPELSIQVE